MRVPGAPGGWLPSSACAPDGPLRMLAPSDCTRTPTAKDPGVDGDTVMLALPLVRSLVAVIVAVPAAIPLTRPVPFTVAMVVSLLDQVMLYPVRACPDASMGVAANCTVAPTLRLHVAGLTAMAAGVPSPGLNEFFSVQLSQNPSPSSNATRAASFDVDVML